MNTQPTSPLKQLRANPRWLAIWGAILVVALIISLIAWRQWSSKSKENAAVANPQVSAIDTSTGADSNEARIRSVTLSKARRDAMGIHTGRMIVEPWNDQRVVQAKLELDPGKHYIVTAPSDLIVEELLVPLGTWVEAGAPLIRLSSSPVSLLRSNLIRQKILADRAMDSLAWHRNVNTEVNALVTRIRESVESGKSLEDLRSNQPTADYGAKIIAAFARYRSAERLLSQTTQFEDTGVLSRKSIIERESEREAAKALLQGTIEQSQFDIRQAILQAEAEQASAQGALENQSSELRKYLGLRPSTSMTWSELEREGIASAGAPDQFVHRSPGSGIVMERYFANGERAAAGANLLLVADTSKLWLVGDLRQQDWDLLDMKKGDTVQAEIIGLESEGLMQATIQMIGGRVGDNSGGIQMTASLTNTNLKLRPGMIARLLPRKGDLTHSLPSRAVFSNDGVDYVLRATVKHELTASADNGPQGTEALDHFEIVTVQCGRRSKDRIEILSGIGLEDEVVLDRVFELASEAFLERE